MKFDPLFLAKDNGLFTLEGEGVQVQGCAVKDAAQCVDPAQVGDGPKLTAINLPWSQVGLDEDSYNEDFLANFREYLKAMEEKNQFAFVVPVADVAVDSDAKKENFALSMKHAARRIKDCVSVVGFAVPAEADASFFMEEMLSKHRHYIFFSKDDSLLGEGSIVRY